MKRIISFVLACAAAFLAGCSSVYYDGQTFPPTKDPEMFTDKSQITKKYTVMGKAAAVGDYKRYTKVDLEKDLMEKAAADGADAVLVYRYEVLPDYECRRDQLMNFNHSNVWTFDDDSRDGNKNLENKFDYYYDYKENRDKSKKGNPIYNRSLKALFIKYNSDGAKPAAVKEEPVKAEAAAPVKAEAPVKIEAAAVKEAPVKTETAAQTPAKADAPVKASSVAAPKPFRGSAAPKTEALEAAPKN